MINNILFICIISLLIIWIVNFVLNRAIGLDGVFLSYNKETTYECGLRSYLNWESLRRTIVRYYLIIVVFIIFEIEVSLLYRILYSYKGLSSKYYIFILFILIGVVIDLIYSLI